MYDGIIFSFLICILPLYLAFLFIYHSFLSFVNVIHNAQARFTMKEQSKDNYSKILEIINCYESISEKLGKKQHLSKSLNEIITKV